MRNLDGGAGTVLVLPEAVLSGHDDRLSGLDGLKPGELARAGATIAAAAQDNGVHVLYGTLLPEHGRWWNAAVYCPPAGESWVYRKVNLATHERGRLAAGSALPTLRMTLPTGDILVAEAPAGAIATLDLTLDLASNRDTYLSQQRDDVVSITWRG
jgi:predicted amidohydrolase